LVHNLDLFYKLVLNLYFTSGKSLVAVVFSLFLHFNTQSTLTAVGKTGNFLQFIVEQILPFWTVDMIPILPATLPPTGILTFRCRS